MRTFAERIVLLSIALGVATLAASAQVGSASSDERQIESEIHKLNDEEVQAFVHMFVSMAK